MIWFTGWADDGVCTWHSLIFLFFLHPCYLFNAKAFSGRMEKRVAAVKEGGVLRAAIEKMLSDAQKDYEEGFEGPSKVKRTYANWRARSIIKEIASLQSPVALEEYEKELRDVLAFQELRRRTKILNEFLTGECDLMENYGLEGQEHAARLSIEAEWTNTIHWGMHICSFMFDEEIVRHQVVLERRSMMKVTRHLFDQSVLRAREERERQTILLSNELLQKEVKQRRLIEVGQEIRYELLRQSLAGVFSKLHAYATQFVKDAKYILRAEERDRIAIEKISFLNFGVLLNEEEMEAVHVMRSDIESHAQRKVETDRSEALTLIRRDMDQLIEHEARVRLMEVESEQKEWQQEYRQFLLGWRDVYQRISQNNEHVATLVSSLELFERRYIYDQYRHGLYGIESIFEGEHRIAQHMERKYDRFFEECTRTMTTLWAEENREFNSVAHQYQLFLIETRVIEKSRVLFAEEEMMRRQTMGEEVRQLIYLKKFSLRDKCVAQALDNHRCMQLHEDSEREQLLYAFRQKCVLLPRETVRREEYLSRSALESSQSNAFIDLACHFQYIQYQSSVAVMSAPLGKEETMCRSLLIESELSERQELVDAFFISAERSNRKMLRRHETYHRLGLRIQLQWQDDTVYRRQMESAHEAALLQCNLQWVEKCEAYHRKDLVKAERDRRAFVMESIPYDQLLLKACEVDELAHRLHIINEAELLNRACAYTYGHDARVEYCSESLRLRQAQLHFQSLDELYDDYQKQLLFDVEPMRRRLLEQQHSDETLMLKLLSEEAACRLHLQSSEDADWCSLDALSSRILGRQRDFERKTLLWASQVERQPTSREQLLQYLQTPVSEVVQSERERRQAARSELSRLLAELYWSRDTIMREESSERLGIAWMKSVSLNGPADEFRVEECFYLHSLVFPNANADDSQRAAAMLVRHSSEVDSRRIDLKAYRFVHIAGSRMEAVVPSGLLPATLSATPIDGVLFFTVLDHADQVIATGSHLLQDGDRDKSCFSVELDNQQGRIHLSKYVTYDS